MSDEGRPATSADAELFAAVYEELKRIASRQLRREANATLCTTELVHETYMRLRGSDAWQGRGHFFGAAARAMRRVLVDCARRRSAARRGGKVTILPLREGDAILDIELDEVLSLDAALVQLEALNPRLSQVVELRFYGGLDTGRVAALLGVTTRTVERDWLKARMFLLGELQRGAAAPHAAASPLPATSSPSVATPFPASAD